MEKLKSLSPSELVNCRECGSPQVRKINSRLGWMPCEHFNCQNCRALFILDGKYLERTLGYLSEQDIFTSEGPND